MSSALPLRLVCRCLGVSSARVHAAVRAGALASVADVTRAVGAGGGCRLCHPEIEEILAEVHGAPVDPACARENRRVCERETRARVESALRSRVAPRLASAGGRVEAVTLQGLAVRVCVAGIAADAAERPVRELLRAAVCVDLQVTVEGPGAAAGGIAGSR
jgi:NifU-like protein